MFRGESLVETGTKAEETGCCEDLKAAFAYMDKFVLRKYFSITKITSNLEENKNDQEMELKVRNSLTEQKIESN